MSEAILYAFIMILVGFLALRFAGRKSISKMTIAQTVIMIAVGSILVEPVKNKDIKVTTVSIAVFIVVLICLELLSFHSEKFEKWIVGDRKIIIQDGQIQRKALKKCRLTVDQLEMNLRTKGISNPYNVKTCTLEPNGNIGYELKEEFKGVSKKQMDYLNENLVFHLKEIHNELWEIRQKLEKE